MFQNLTQLLAEEAGYDCRRRFIRSQSVGVCGAGVRMAGRWMIPSVPFKEAYFLEDALKFRAELSMPLIYVGGLVSRAKIDEVLDNGFEAVQMARALLNEPGFVNRMRKEENARCSCRHSNYCIARMYSIEMACHQHLQEELPACLKKEIEKIEAKG